MFYLSFQSLDSAGWTRRHPTREPCSTVQASHKKGCCREYPSSTSTLAPHPILRACLVVFSGHISLSRQSIYPARRLRMTKSHPIKRFMMLLRFRISPCVQSNTAVSFQLYTSSGWPSPLLRRTAGRKPRSSLLYPSHPIALRHPPIRVVPLFVTAHPLPHENRSET